MTNSRCVCVRKAPASVRKASVSVAHPAVEMVAKRRTVVSAWTSRYRSVNGQRDRGRPGRETQNCRHFWACLSSCRKSVKNHKDRGVLAAKHITVVTFGLAFRRRV